MPIIPLLLFGGGALLGGGSVWVASEATQKIVTLGLLGGAIYLYTKRG